MDAILIGNGEIKDYKMLESYIKKSNTIVICCDGGLKHTYKLDMKPDYIIGDFDSAPSKLLRYYKKFDIPMKVFPEKKDKTDMELGLEFALDLKPKEIFIFGGIGSRFDHTLANANILKIALECGVKASLINEVHIINLINKKFSIVGNKGDLLSLIPLTQEVSGVTTFGLEYPLDNAVIKIGSSIGISNVFISNEVNIIIKEGLLLVIQTKENE